MKIFKMNIFTKNKLKVLFSFVFIALIFAYICAFNGDDPNYSFYDYFSENMLAELIGVCLEFIVILFLIDHVQKKEEKKRKTTSEKRLREIFIFFLREVDLFVPELYQIKKSYLIQENGKDEFLYGMHYKKNQKYLNSLMEYFNDNKLSEDSISKIEKFCGKEIATVRCLIPVVATLDDQNFKSWIRIIFYIDAIISKDYPIEKSLAKIIEHIKEFEKASYKNGWLVKND